MLLAEPQASIIAERQLLSDLWDHALWPSAQRFLPFTLLFLSVALVLFVIPVSLSNGALLEKASGTLPDWFTDTEVVRIFDPLVTLTAHWVVFAAASREATQGLPNVAFIIAAAIYVEGDGIHLTADMLSRPIEDFEAQYAAQNVSTNFPMINDVFAWSKTTWEHTAGHYIYGAPPLVFWKSAIGSP
jgi:hypothetical protein